MSMINRRRKPVRPVAGVLPDTSIPETIIRAAPSLARYAMATWRRAAELSLSASAHAASRLAAAAVARESPSEVLDALAQEMRDYGRELLGIADIEARVWRVIAPEAVASGATEPGSGRDGSAASLKARGAELMRRSADVAFNEDTHPAYARILTELAPDEARILRFLALEGPQPAVDVRTSRPLNMASQMIEPGLSMIGPQAGCRRVERVPAYLNNLFRLGLIWFSREPVSDARRYQVLEVQPDVMDAKKRAGRGKTVRRSIHLTPFGIDFCEMCLPLGKRPRAGDHLRRAPPAAPGARTSPARSASDVDLVPGRELLAASRAEKVAEAWPTWRHRP